MSQNISGKIDSDINRALGPVAIIVACIAAAVHECRAQSEAWAFTFTGAKVQAIFPIWAEGGSYDRFCVFQVGGSYLYIYWLPRIAEEFCEPLHAIVGETLADSKRRCPALGRIL